MEQAQQYYWRRELVVKSHFMNNIIDRHHSSSSWEERAFAEDHHGGVGGCIWPPRSYSCSFCRREFRSAQALGGHMNVHRKDRARLKQSSSSSSPPHHQPNDVCHPPHDDHQNLKSLDYHDHHHHHHDHHPNSSSSIVLASTPPSRVSVFSTNESSIHHSFLKQQKGFNVSSISRPEVVKNPRKEASAICNLFGAELVMELNPEVLSSKRPKTDVFTLSILSKPCSNDRCGLQSEVRELNSSSLEDIDLELRLGQPPKGI